LRFAVDIQISDPITKSGAPMFVFDGICVAVALLVLAVIGLLIWVCVKRRIVQQTPSRQELVVAENDNLLPHQNETYASAQATQAETLLPVAEADPEWELCRDK
jgi:hypothetical protein